MSSRDGPTMRGNFRRSASMMSRVSSTESVVCVRYATLEGSGTSREATASAFATTRMRWGASPSVPMTDQHDGVALAGVTDRLQVHLGDEGTGGVDHAQAAPARLVAHGGRDPVRAEDDGRVVGRLVQLVDEDRALGPQRLDDVAVVN